MKGVPREIRIVDNVKRVKLTLIALNKLVLSFEENCTVFDVDAFCGTRITSDKLKTYSLKQNGFTLSYHVEGKNIDVDFELKDALTVNIRVLSAVIGELRLVISKKTFSGKSFVLSSDLDGRTDDTGGIYCLHKVFSRGETNNVITIK